MSFEKIFTHGVLVDVNVGMWTGQRRLQAEDLGIQADRVPEAFTLGHKKLVPADIITSLKHFDYRARSVLEKFSFPFEFGQARFVPKKVFPEFAQEMDTVITEYMTVVDKFVADYPTYKIKMRKDYTAAAGQAYDRLRTLCGYSKPRSEFINEFLDRVEGFYPKVEQIRSKFHMEYVVFQVSLPDLSQASYEDVAQDNEKMQLMQQAYQKALYKRVQSFVDTIIGGLRNKASTIMAHVASNIKAGKRITEATIRSLRKMVEDYDRMDIIGDADMTKRLQDLKTRVLDHITSKQITESAKLRSNLRKELEALVNLADDKTALKALADGYRNRIQL